MKTKIIIVLLLLGSAMGFSQQLTYKSGGRVYNSQNQKMSPDDVRALLITKPGILNFYNEGRTKKTVGNVFLIGGSAFIVADLLNGLTRDVEYPSALTYIGAAAIIVSIPVKIGYSKKIKTAVTDYNKEIAHVDKKFEIESVSICANGNGIGLKIGF